MVGAPGVDGQPQRHRLQRARLVPGQLQALDLRREVDRALADDLGRPPRPLGQQLAEARAGADEVERAQQRGAVAEPQPRRVDQPALGALHRPGDRAAGRDRVQAQLVAAGAGREHVVRVGHPAQRPEREHVLVLHALAPAALAGVDVLAADRAGRARVAGHPAQLVQLLGGQPGRAVEGGRGEVAGRERGDGVEREQVGQGAQLAVLRGGRAEAARPQVLRRGQHGRLVVDVDPGGRPDQDGLEVLGPQDRAQPAAAGVAAVVADRGVADLPLPGRPDGRGLPATPEPLPHRRLGLRRRQPGQLRRGFETGAAPPSTRSTESSAARPRTTIASFPVSLPAIANRLDASASVSSPVSGDLATTANFALVVSGVPTSGENTNASGASGASGSTPGGASRCSSQVPRPTPPR